MDTLIFDIEFVPKSRTTRDGSDFKLLRSLDRKRFENMDRRCKELGLFKKPESYLIFDVDMRFKFANNISKGVDLLNAFSYDYEMVFETFRIRHMNDNPYFTVTNAPFHSSRINHGIIVPMSWMEKALQSDIGERVKTIMQQNDKVLGFISEHDFPSEVIKTYTYKSAQNYRALDDFRDAKNQFTQLASNLAALDFLKFKNSILWIKGNMVFTCDDLQSHSVRDDFCFKFGSKVFSHGTYRFREPPSKKLVVGIRDILTKGSQEEILHMVDGLFGKHRLKMISCLEKIGNKELGMTR